MKAHNVVYPRALKHRGDGVLALRVGLRVGRCSLHNALEPHRILSSEPHVFLERPRSYR